MVAWLSAYAPLGDASFDNLRIGLRERGFEDGRNVKIHIVSAVGQLEKLPLLANELVRAKVDVIIAGNEVAARAAIAATSTIPIVVVVWSDDPVTLGLVESFSRPSGNVTGIAALPSDLDGKRLEILKEALPNLSRVAVFLDPAVGSPIEQLEHAGRQLRLKLHIIEVRRSEDLAGAFHTASQHRVGAVLLRYSPIFYPHRDKIIDLARVTSVL